jgi:hypothetical protein
VRVTSGCLCRLETTPFRGVGRGIFGDDPVDPMVRLVALNARKLTTTHACGTSASIYLENENCIYKRVRLSMLARSWRTSELSIPVQNDLTVDVLIWSCDTTLLPRLRHKYQHHRLFPIANLQNPNGIDSAVVLNLHYVFPSQSRQLGTSRAPGALREFHAKEPDSAA